MINLSLDIFCAQLHTSLIDLLLVGVINAHTQDQYQIKKNVKKVVMNDSSIITG